jgi:hypothetical protein
MPRGLQVSRLLIANMVTFVNISNFFKLKKKIYIMTFRVAHWDMLDDSLASYQGENIFECINNKCHMFAF